MYFVVCSRGWAYCLDDEPMEYKHRKLNYPVIPPGTMYDADHQCRLVYGPEAELCDGIQVNSNFWHNKQELFRLETYNEQLSL